MKRTLGTALLALTFLVGLRTSAHAQALVTVDVPHEFVVNNSKVLPAGSYVVSRASIQGSNHALIIRKQDGTARTFVLPTTFEGNFSDKTQLSFVSINGVYTLRTVETPLGVYTFATRQRQTRIVKKDVMDSSSGN